MALPPDPTRDSPHPSAAAPVLPAAYARAQFIVVKIPVVPDFDDLYHQREDTIDRALRAKRLGSVLGWGASLGAPTPDGARPVAHTRVDIDVADIETARAELQATLAAIGAPAGTEIHYTLQGKDLADVYAPPDWRQGRPVVRGRPAP
jgi:hypothetical protein